MDRCQSCFREYDGTVCPYCGGAQNEEHQLPVGTMIRERYKIGRVLGQGGFGITYIAWDTLLDKCVAVKEFYPNGTVFRRNEVSTAVECGTKTIIPHYEYSRERFLREARALAKFQDIPEVVGLLDFVKENNTAYIVMEYVRGVDLAKYIRMKGGKLTAQETFRILKPVMEALAKVHKGGIVHRDISPDNIILDPMGGAKLLDFGAVRAVKKPDVDTALNKSTEAILKQGFAPLEQYNSRGSLGPWTDEYAMCATVWYCLTGKVPEDASIRMMEGIDPDWSSIEGLPLHQQKALEKGFSCRAKDRYKDLDELLADLFPEAAPASAGPLGEAQTKEKSPGHPKGEKQKPTSTGNVEKKPSYEKKQLWIIAAVAVLIIFIVTVVFLPKAPKSTTEETQPPQLQEITEDTEPTTEATEPTTEETEPTTEPLSEEELQYLQAEHLLAEGKLGKAAIAFGKLAGYSDAKDRSFAIWDDIAIRDTISAGCYHTIGLKNDGTVISAGADGFGQCDVDEWTDIIAVSAGGSHSIGLKSDGTVVATGRNEYGQCDVSEWENIVAISAGEFHTLGLKSDGTVVAAGWNGYSQSDVNNWTNIVAISGGNYHTLGLRVDGTAVAVGRNNDGQCEVNNWRDIISVSAGRNHSVGLKLDGTVVAVGLNSDGRCNVSEWSNIISISTFSQTLGLKSDGTVVAVGSNNYGQLNIPDWTDVVSVAAGLSHTVVLFSHGEADAVGGQEFTGYKHYGQCNVFGWVDIQLPLERVPFQ